MLYTPKAFSATDADAHKMMKENPFALLASWGNDDHFTPRPMFLSDDGHSLYGHFAGANPHSLIDPTEFRHRAIFTGPNAYISPGWYEDQNQVPTWNYLAVHITGSLDLINDPARVEAIVARLTSIAEAPFEPSWTMDKLDPEKRDRLISSITGCQLVIESIECKFKLSQNKSTESMNLVKGLRAHDSRSNDAAIADAMLEYTA